MFRDFLGRPLSIGQTVAQRCVTNPKGGALQKHMGLIGVVRKFGTRRVWVQFPHDPVIFHPIEPLYLVRVFSINGVWFARIPEGLEGDVDDSAQPISYERYEGEEVEPYYNPELAAEPYDPRQTLWEVREKTRDTMRYLAEACESLSAVVNDSGSPRFVRLDVRHEDLVRLQRLAEAVKDITSRLADDLKIIQNESDPSYDP